MYILILGAIIITGRADLVVPERNRGEGDQVPVDGQVGDYGGFPVNLNTEDQLSDGLSFSGLNEAGESFGAEANAVTGYDGKTKFNGDNILTEKRFGHGNQLKASISSEVQTGKENQYAELVEADATDQSKLQAQFGQGAQYGEANFQENQRVQLSEVPTVLPPTQGIMQYPHGTTPGSQLNYGLLGPSVYGDSLKKNDTFKEYSMLVPYSELLNKLAQKPGSLYAVQSKIVPSNPTNAYRGVTGYDVTQSSNWIPYKKVNPPNISNNNKNWNPYTKPAGGDTLVQVDGEIQSDGKTEAKTKVQENGKQNPDWSPYQKRNPPNISNNNKNWNPYTKPAEGETLVQVDGEIQSDGKTEAKTKVQENGKQNPDWSPYQKRNPQNVYNNNKNWNPYTKPADGETLVQVDGDIQNSGKTETDTVVQEIGKRSPNWIQYQKGNPNLSVLQTNLISPNSYNTNWNPYTKPAEGETLVQPDAAIQGGGKTYANIVVDENNKQNNNWVPYQKGNPNNLFVQTDVVSSNSNDNNWNPYTRPTEGETLVQADGEIKNGEKVEAAHENGKTQFQKETQANSVVQTSKGLKVVNAVDKTFAGYGGHYNSEIPPPLIGQINSENQNGHSTQTDTLVQSNGGFQYSGENKATDDETQANIATSYSGGSPHNVETQYLTAAQINEGIMNGGAKNSESALYGNSNKYGGRYLNGENGAQFGAAVDGKTVAQAGPVVEARFSQITHPSRRPSLAFGHLDNRWHHG